MPTLNARFKLSPVVAIASIADIEVEDLAFDKVRLYIGDEDSNCEMLFIIEDKTPVGNGRNNIKVYTKKKRPQQDHCLLV